MKKLSTGCDSTLGNYKEMAEVVFGHSSKAISHINDKIAESGNGKDEEVLADEGQMIRLLSAIHFESS